MIENTQYKIFIKPLSLLWRYYLIVHFGGILFCQDIDNKIAIYREDFSEILIKKQDTRYLLNQVYEKMSYTCTEIDEQTLQSEKEECVYLTIWAIKALFLEGEIDKSRKLFKSQKEVYIKNGDNKSDSLMLLSLNKLTKNYSETLCVEPYSKDIKSCEPDDCLCESLNQKFDNLDFLKDNEFYKYFTDITIEFHDGGGQHIPIREASSVMVKDTDYDVTYTLNPPVAAFDSLYYDYNLENSEILKFYFEKSRENRLILLEDDFIKQSPKKDLWFDNSYVVNEDGDKFSWFHKLTDIPRVKSLNDKNNPQYYRLYIHENDPETGVEIVTARHSFKIIYKESKKKKKKTSSSDITVYIRWHENWEMAQLMEAGKVFLLLPIEYIKDRRGESWFTVRDLNLAQDKKELREEKIFRRTFLNDTTSVLIEDFYSSTEGNNQINTLIKKEIDSKTDSTLHVVEVEIEWEDGGNIEIELTDDIDNYISEQNKINNKRRLLYQVVAGAFLALILII